MSKVLHRKSAPGRVCLVGEDIDWISGPSILCAIDLRVHVGIKARLDNKNWITVTSTEPLNYQKKLSLNEIGIYSGHESDYINAAIKVFSERVSKITPMEISIQSTLPAKAGLSSSAAVLVATIAALCEHFRINVPDQEVCHLAYLAENQELNTGVGQMDLYSCGLGGTLYLNSATTPPSPIERYTFPPDISVIIVDTLTPRNTRDVIKEKRNRLLQSDPLLLAYVEHTLEAIDKIRKMLKKPTNNIKDIGNLVFTCHEYIRDYLQVSTDLLDECVERCKKSGALGAKLTGTGMGGCMFALVEKNNEEKVIASLLDLPVKVYATSISNSGII